MYVKGVAWFYTMQVKKLSRIVSSGAHIIKFSYIKIFFASQVEMKRRKKTMKISYYYASNVFNQNNFRSHYIFCLLLCV